jgi:hypothetical protein
MAARLSYDFFIPSALNGADFSDALTKLFDTPMDQRRVDYGAFYFDVSDAEVRNGQTVGLVSRHRMRNLPLRVIRGQARCHVLLIERGTVALVQRLDLRFIVCFCLCRRAKRHAGRGQGND